MTVCVVVLGGDAPDLRVTTRIPFGAFVIAADSGVDHAVALGLSIDLAVGDFDSVSLAGLAHLQQEQVPTQRYPADKDASDGELALRAAHATDPTQIVVVTGGGMDRLDHLAMTLAMLTGPQTSDVAMVAWIGANQVLVVREGITVQFGGTIGQTVTLLAVHGAASGVTTTGLRWPLKDATLDSWSTRGLSNLTDSTTCSVTVRSGTVAVVRPAALNESHAPSWWPAAS